MNFKFNIHPYFCIIYNLDSLLPGLDRVGRVLCLVLHHRQEYSAAHLPGKARGHVRPQDRGTSARR